MGRESSVGSRDRMGRRGRRGRMGMESMESMESSMGRDELNM